MNKVAEAFLKVAERYESLARCEPDWVYAQNLRFLARHMKEEAARLSDVPDNVKENDGGPANPV